MDGIALSEEVGGAAAPSRWPVGRGAGQVIRRVVVELDQVEHDLKIRYPSGATAGQVVDSIWRRLTGGASPDTVGAWLARTGESVRLDERFEAAGLIHGDRLVIAATRGEALDGKPQPETTPAIELVVRGGPDAGRRYPLSHKGALGTRALIGREAADIVIDDPTLSPTHASIALSDNGWYITDMGSHNGSFSGDKRLSEHEPELLGWDDELRMGSTVVAVHRGSDGDRPTPRVEAEGNIRLNRPPRVLSDLPAKKLTAAAPPSQPTTGKITWTAIALPVLVAPVSFLLTREPLSLLFVLLSPAVLAARIVEERVGGRRSYRAKLRAWQVDFGRKLQDYRLAVIEERSARLRAAPDLAELVRRAESADPKLWERRLADHDFLRLRLGLADQIAASTLIMPREGDSDWLRRAETKIKHIAKLPSVPMCVDLDSAGGVAILGPEAMVNALGRSLLLQAGALHSPGDVVICAAVPASRRPQWDWVQWLPHAQDDRSEDSRLYVGTEQAEGLLRELEAASGAADRQAIDDRRTLLLLDEAVVRSPEQVYFLERAVRSGVRVIWLGTDTVSVPAVVTTIVQFDALAPRLTVTTTVGDQWPTLVSDGVSVAVARRAALALAPLTDVREAIHASIPTTVSLDELLPSHVNSASQTAESWAAVRKLGPAAVGKSADGIVAIDLATHPHALVGGVTGSGKSEFLRTTIGSLAARHPPSVLTLLLIDWKGDSAFRSLAKLPHVVGHVTDLEQDADLAIRAVAAVEAEQQYRKRILSEGGAADIRMAEGTTGAVPRLVIVVDEFAELKDRLPGLVTRLVNVARVGRSLGMHLVLATQRPGTSVDTDIQSQTAIRVALRVVDANDSNAVLGSPAAARIQDIGRAYLRVSGSGLTEFQTGYGVRSDVELAVEVEPLGRKTQPVEPREAGEFSDEKKRERAQRADAHLEALVGTLQEAARRTERTPVRPVWLPPLPARLTLSETKEVAGPPDAGVIGLVDLPMQQEQRVLLFEPRSDANMAVYGAHQTGKTTLLRTVVASLAERQSPHQLQVYGIAFGDPSGLQSLESFPHVGSIVPGDDRERVQRLFRWLRAEISERRALIDALGRNPYADAIQADDDVRPRIVVLLDGYESFVHSYQATDFGRTVDGVAALAAEGPAIGIHLLLTALRSRALPGPLTTAMNFPVVLSQASQDEYVMAGVDRAAVPAGRMPPGRAIVHAKDLVQVALLAAEGSGAAERDATLALGRRLTERHPVPAQPIGRLPQTVSVADLGSPSHRSCAIVGIEDFRLGTAEIDLQGGHFLICGPYRSGRTTALLTIAESLRLGDPSLRLHVFLPRSTAGFRATDTVAVVRGEVDVPAALLRLVDRPLDRQDVVLIDDGETMDSPAVGDAIGTLIARGRASGARVVAASEVRTAHQAFAGWLKDIRKDQRGLLLAPDRDLDGSLLGTKLPKGEALPPGRGYLVERGVLQLVQVAVPSASS